MTSQPEEPSFKFKSIVSTKQTYEYGEVLYFPLSFKETNEKLRKHSFQPGDAVEITVRLKKKPATELENETAIKTFP